MSETADYLKRKAAGLESEFEAYLSKAREFRAMADEMEEKAADTRRVLLRVQEWAASDFPTPAPPASNDNPTENDVPPTDSPASTGAPQIRKMVRDFLLVTRDFASSELVDAIVAEVPEVKVPSIHGELSKAKSRGEVETTGRSQYRSLIYQRPNGHATYEPSQPLESSELDISEIDEGTRANGPKSSPSLDNVDDMEDITDPFAE